MRDRDRVCPASHRHGETPTCYRDHKCGCGDCRHANRVRMNVYNKKRAYGYPTSDLTDAAPVQAWIRDLMAVGMTPVSIAEAAGLSRSAVRRILSGGVSTERAGRPYRIQRATATAIMSVRADITILSPDVRVTARGAHRRLEALEARGWSLSELNRRLGLRRCRLHRACQQRWIPAALYLQIADLYDQLWDQDPPIATRGQRVARSIALHRAAAAGWVPPLGWDDIDTDPAPAVIDDGPVVDEIAIHLALRGEPVALTAIERFIAVEDGTRLGMSLRELAERTQVTDRHALRLRAGSREAA